MVPTFAGYRASEDNAASAAQLRGANVDLRSQLDGVTGERDKLVATRADAEAAVKSREDAAKNTIAEGDWAVGVDIQPGTYRTKEPVSDDCYWASFSDT